MLNSGAATPALSRRRLLALLPLTGGLLLTGCGSKATVADEALTGEQAEQFATMRFRLHQGTSFRATVAVVAALALDAEVQVNLVAGTGYGTFSSSPTADVTQTGLIAWSEARLAVAGEAKLDGAEADADWYARSTDTSSISDLFLLLLLSLGTDRPENPQLLQQSTARFVGTDEIDGERCQIFSGPREAGSDAGSRTRYWLGENGELRRFQAYLDTTQEQWSTATLAPADEAYTITPTVEQLLAVGS